MATELDLTPDPRVLQMLGEINLQQWRCVAELIDNSIDSFLTASRDGTPILNPEISVVLPTKDDDNARVSIKDNGPGMSVESLEKAVRAGWTGNNPISSLGLFGMGFNISTARLGLVTEVWTTREGDPEYVGVRIDLEELRRNRTFKVPRQTRPKAQREEHGTEIVISRLKPDQRAYLSRTTNIKTVRKQLSKTYSPLLAGTSTVPLRLKLNGTRVEPRRHCIWNEDRSVTLPDGTTVNAVETISVQLAPRRFCMTCMITLRPDEHLCPNQTPNCDVVETERSIRGWIGLQRYLDETDFGFDFIRNGRKIEIANKDLFVWSDGDATQVEYPTDDPRGRGRFVGELHIDHCRVSYTKDRFERDDPAWEEMVKLIRGEGPLRPLTAKQQGYGPNNSPLFRLFQAFRRTSPQGKNALWSRFLVVRANERAQQLAESFYDNDPEYLSDDKWWELVEEQDREVLGDVTSGKDDVSDTKIGPEGFSDTPLSPADFAEESDPPITAPPVRTALFELSRKYIHPVYRVEYEVLAYSVAENDPVLSLGTPWALNLDEASTRTYGYLVNETHPVFRSKTMTPLDGLMIELAFRTLEFLRGQVKNLSLSTILADLRTAYCTESRLDATEIIASAAKTINEIASSFSTRTEKEEAGALLAEMSPIERAALTKRIASRNMGSFQEVINSGRFLEFADPEAVATFFTRHPELFLDSKYWDDPYNSLDYGVAEVTQEAQLRVVARYKAYLDDAIWLIQQSPADLDNADRDLLIRATCALRLLRPDVVTNE